MRGFLLLLGGHLECAHCVGFFFIHFKRMVQLNIFQFDALFLGEGTPAEKMTSADEIDQERVIFGQSHAIHNESQNAIRTHFATIIIIISFVTYILLVSKN